MIFRSKRPSFEIDYISDRIGRMKKLFEKKTKYAYLRIAHGTASIIRKSLLKMFPWSAGRWSLDTGMEIPRPPKENRQTETVEMDDIKHSNNNGSLEKIIRAEKMSERASGNTGRGQRPNGIIWGIVGLIVLFLGGFIILFYSVREKTAVIVSSRFGNLEAGTQALENFDLRSAAREFASSNEGLSVDLKNAAGAFGFLFQNGGPFNSFLDISKQLTSLSGELSGLEESFFSFLSTGNGGNLVSGLVSARDTLHAINADMSGVSGAFSFLGSVMPHGIDLLSLRTEIGDDGDFLDAFVQWFSAQEPHHILVLFQNPSEIRPAGGFLGSYADVTIQGGNIENVAVHDVADVDAAFKENIVPPKPLQAEVSRWRPADANWFFDFNDSASETASFFERSDLYAASSTKFDVVIAVSPKVMRDLLSLVGTVSISSTKMTFASDTFLVNIQKMVQNGQATGATYPKAVLTELVEAMFQKIVVLNDSQKQTMISMAVDWANKKDVMLYSANPVFENFFGIHGMAGTVAELPQNFEGDYLAVVDANILGQKSDLYIAQDVNLESQINIDGTVSDSVIINRKHNGDQSPYWWYSAANQDYLQLFVPDGSTLSNESGGIKKNIVAPVSYIKSGYSNDPMVSTIESTQKDIFGYPVSSHEESGKEVFSTWSRVTAGNTTTISFDYSHRLFLLPADGISYQFIFEKQAGVVRHYKFEIVAPIGFQFVENGLPSYDYESNDPPGRLVINLTLRKI